MRWISEMKWKTAAEPREVRECSVIRRGMQVAVLNTLNNQMEGAEGW